MAAVSVLLKFWRPKDNWKHGKMVKPLKRSADSLSAQGQEGTPRHGCPRPTLLFLAEILRA
jgi:hypothetical protein